MKNIAVHNFAEWRIIARECCLRGIRPEDIIWIDKNTQHALLFVEDFVPEPIEGELKVSSGFISFAKTIAYHSNPKRWFLLYQALWRITQGEKHLLSLFSDPLVCDLNLMQKAVKRDAHKAKAFIRFKKYTRDNTDIYVAWHEPDHAILQVMGSFFARRYSDMIWSVFTPTESMHWDLKTLRFGEGSTKEKVEKEDEMDNLWKEYYRAIFNPARIKIKAMKKEMPVRYWKNLPEASIIPSLLTEAPARVLTMLDHAEGWHKSAADFIPDTEDIDILSSAAKKCAGCPLYVCGTQMVFGEGSKRAELMIIGEQPGDKEDQLGRPFVGPAGKLLDKALEAADLNRRDLYITNAIKHFEFKMVNGQRQNITPNLRKILDCNAWLQAEIKAINPKIILTFGVVAGRALFGSAFKLKESLGRIQMLEDRKVISTIHPAYILRTQDNEQKKQLTIDLMNDLKFAKSMLH